jgi:hypothetical protein
VNAIPVRITVQDAWDQVTLTLAPTASVQEAKRRALILTHVTGRPEDYVVKYRGAELLDEGGSLADHGVVPNAALIVLPRRRRPVR